MDWKKLLLASFAYAVISQVVRTVGAMLSMGYYTDPQYSSLWSGLMMPDGGAPGLKFFAASFATAVIIGIIFTYTYIITKPAFKQKKASDSGVMYGMFLFLITGVPALLSTALTLSLPFPLLLNWQVESLAIYLLFGMMVARMYK